jgi:SAM-dependent methyltransferase
MPDLNWNADLWDGSYDWKSEGEEWSFWWGGSEAQWVGSIYPRIHRLLPARKILEIAPGFGRWTNYLLKESQSYVGIDFSKKVVEACKRRFASCPKAEFFQNDGLSLRAAADNTFDLIFSFDSLVHAELDVLREYIPQIVRKLSMNGVAFIHHSNFFDMAPGIANPHSRATSVSAQKFSDIVAECGGIVLVQEILNWGGPDLIDCVTMFGKAEAFANRNTVRIVNSQWVDEMNIIREIQSPYSKIPIDMA